MNALRISVALCTYNGAPFLGEQLESIAAQTRQPDELVVFDDRSADGTPDILREFGAKARFPVRLNFNPENVGSTKNFERAIRACSGDVIALSDQDDVWLPEKLARTEAVFDASPEVGLVFSDGAVVDAELRPLGHRLWQAFLFKPRLQRRLREGRATEVLLKYNVVTGATMAFRSRHIPLILPIPEGVVHDWWIALLISFVAPLMMIPAPLVRYRQHGGNQIGGARLDWSVSVGRARGIGGEVFREVADGYRAAYDRIRSCAGPLCRENLVAMLCEKIRHFEARGSLPGTIFGRLPTVFGELASLRYHRYSLGMKSFFKDLFLHRSVPPRETGTR